MGEQMAIDRWENEGGEILELALLNLKKSGYVDRRRSEKTTGDAFEKVFFVKRWRLSVRKKR